MGERAKEGQSKSKCFVFVTGKVPAMGYHSSVFIGQIKPLYLTVNVIPAFHGYFLRTLEGA